MDITLSTNVYDVNEAFKSALHVVEKNIRPTKVRILQGEQLVLHAGAGYEGAWTRDAAVNVWNAGSLFPEVAKTTLLSVLEKTNSTLSIGGEYWDSLIFFLGAWSYYRFSRDESFLSLAYDVSLRTLRERELHEFDMDIGLFRGPGVYNDGVSGYPDSYLSPSANSAISESVKRKAVNAEQQTSGLSMHTLSTNCLYYQVYRLLEVASNILKLDFPLQTSRAQALRDSINRHFWNNSLGRYTHIIDEFGGDYRQESLGIAFSILFAVAPYQLVKSIIKNTTITREGIPCIWPTYPRYKREAYDYGRHSGTVWPFIQAFWGECLADLQNTEAFGGELLTVAARAVRDQTFFECYHPTTGQPYGGLQEQNGELVNSSQLRMSPLVVPEEALGKSGIVEWRSMPDQVWSATGYLRMIINNLIGLRFTDKVIVFRPTVPSCFEEIEIRDLPFGDNILDIFIKGSGCRVKSFSVDGVKSQSHWLDRSKSGRRRVSIECCGSEVVDARLHSLDIY